MDNQSWLTNFRTPCIKVGHKVSVTILCSETLTLHGVYQIQIQESGVLKKIAVTYVADWSAKSNGAMNPSVVMCKYVGNRQW